MTLTYTTNMKRTLCLNTIAVAIAVMVGGVGCKKTTKPVTPIPARMARAPGPAAGPGPLTPGGTFSDQGTDGTAATSPGEGILQADMGEFEGMLMDTNSFAAATVYFDFDSSVVKSSETEKADSVAEQLKLQAANKLLIDGHCDERGTEEYNRALGEERALSLREYLVSRGIGGDRIRTRTWGEDMPADTAHDETAWGRNRRGEFILLLPR